MNREEMREKLVALRARQEEAAKPKTGEWQHISLDGKKYSFDWAKGEDMTVQTTYVYRVKCHVQAAQWIPLSWLDIA